MPLRYVKEPHHLLQRCQNAAPPRGSVEGENMIISEMRIYQSAGEVTFCGAKRMNLNHAKRQQLDVHDFTAIIIVPIVICGVGHSVIVSFVARSFFCV